MHHQPGKKDSFSGLLWFAFSGTAMFAAVFLPIHLLAILFDRKPLINHIDANLVTEAYFFILLFATLYHSLYRSKSLIFDLGLTGLAKIMLPLVLILVALGSIALFWFIFLNS